jgi:hypothetical protein
MVSKADVRVTQLHSQEGVLQKRLPARILNVAVRNVTQAGVAFEIHEHNVLQELWPSAYGEAPRGERIMASSTL